MKNAFLEMVSSADGSISFMRVAVLLVVVAVLFNWCFLTYKTGVKQPLNWDEVALIVGSLGVKAAQRPFESKLEPPKPEPAKP